VSQAPQALLPHSTGRDALALCAIKAGICACVLALGFSHVSDDDYARTVIAEQLAHAPRVDPSGTSWLPLPFWVEGLAMAAFGRTLPVARSLAVVLGAVSVAVPYAALRVAGVARWASVAGTALAMALPWSAWLGAATVPESWVGALVGGALIAAPVAGARPWCAAALCAASLSRYEAWPAAGLVAAGWLLGARKAAWPRRDVVCSVAAVCGVAAWVAWNAHAHGDPLHFLTRVRTFRHAIGAADVPLADKVLGYPRALATETPEVPVLVLLGAAGLAVDGGLRARWRWPLACAAAVLVFLIVGDVRDGAPTHHPARALSPLWWVAAGWGADAVAVLAARTARSQGARRGALVAGAIAALGWCALLPARWSAAPGKSESEDRAPQIARGNDMRARDVAAAEVTPCAFEHFALLAAWGNPERARIHERTGGTPTPACPLVEER
jgi:hypothetical protein